MENNSDEPELGYTGDLPNDRELAEYLAAWDFEMQIDDVEAKMEELLALKPANISEIKYRDERLSRLCRELESLRNKDESLDSRD